MGPWTGGSRSIALSNGIRSPNWPHIRDSTTTVSSQEAFSFPVSLILILTLVLLCLQHLSPVCSSPVPAPGGLEVLDGVHEKGKEKLSSEAGGVKTLKKSGPGLLKGGLLGTKLDVLKEVPVTKEVVKSDGVVNKAAGTGAVLTESEENAKAKEKRRRKKHKKKHGGDDLMSTTTTTPKSEDSDEDDDDEDDKRRDSDILTGGITKVADVGKNGGRDFKILARNED